MAARRKLREGSLPREELGGVEDQAIFQALDRQRQVDIEVFTDGEYRRDAWQTGFSQAVDGFAPDFPVQQLPTAGGGTVTVELHSKPIVARLTQRHRIAGNDAAFMRHHSPGPFKITLPSPNSIVWMSWRDGITDAVYSSRDELRQELVAIYQAEVRDLVADGATYIQLDEGFNRYVNPDWRRRVSETGSNLDEALEADISTENLVYDAVAESSVVIGSHLCRGSRTSARGIGTYDDWLLERLFSELDVDRFLLEYDSDEFGDFRPLRFLPAGKIAVLGLVSSKEPGLESQEYLIRKVETASEYCPLDQLALSPQCGFGGSADNDFMSFDQQFSKLANLVETAIRIWASRN